MLKPLRQKNRKSMNGFSIKEPQQKAATTHNLKSLTEKIESDSRRSKQFIEQLKIEKLAARKLGNTVNETFVKVETQGTLFASKLEQQRYKNVQCFFILEALLSKLTHYYENLINQEKVDRYHENKDKKQNDEYEACQNKLKQVEKQFEHVTLRKNSSSYEVSKKVDQVRTLRSERAILNGVFDQFQKQIFDYKHQYRTLMIECCALNRMYQERVLQLQKIAVTTQKQTQKTDLKIKAIENNMPLIEESVPITQFDAQQSIQLPSTIRNDELSRNKRPFNTRRHAMEISQAAKINSEITKLDYEKRIHKIYYDLGINNCNEIFIDREDLSEEISSLYGVAEDLYEKIYKKKKLLEEQTKKKDNLIGKTTSKQKYQSLKSTIARLTTQQQELQTSLYSFFQKDFNALLSSAPTTNHPHTTISQWHDQMQRNSTKISTIIKKYEEERKIQRIQVKKQNEKQKRPQRNQGRLQKILEANKTTKNNMRLYTEQQLLEISRYNLRNSHFLQEEQKLSKQVKAQ